MSGSSLDEILVTILVGEMDHPLNEGTFLQGRIIEERLVEEGLVLERISWGPR